ncbi:hypothetical protein GGR52DRAFT_549624 [Hypoxylon sp. FL1284]|nr:hypothetical protein GGR52DRAFT_549624 [Hypoxylon sp. FL1284]
MSSPQAPVQPPLDYYNNGPGMLASCCILAFLATVATAARFWSRKLTGFPLGLDDWLALASLIIQHAFLVCSFVDCILGGLGRDQRLVLAEDPNSIVVLFKGIFAGEVFYGLSSPLIKLSVLAFYWRIFPTRFVKMGCTVLAVLSIGWAVAIFITNFLQCRPLRAFWHQELQLLPETRCFDAILYFLGNSTANCVIDFATLVLPLREIFKLQTTRAKKFGIGAVFILGGVAFAASLTRTISTAVIYNEGITNFSKQFVVSGVATVVEVYAAIIGACLPMMVPVYRKLRYGDPRSAAASQPTADSGLNTIGKISNRKHFRSIESESSMRLDNDESMLVPASYGNSQHVNVSSPKDRDNFSSDADNIPMEGIVVMQDMTWSDHPSNRV